MLGKCIAGKDGVVADHGANGLHFVLQRSVVVAAAHAGVQHLASVSQQTRASAVGAREDRDQEAIGFTAGLARANMLEVVLCGLSSSGLKEVLPLLRRTRSGVQQ